MNDIIKNMFLLLLLITTNLFGQSQLDLGDFENVETKFGGSIDQKAPIIFAYKYSVTQQIYTQDELTSIAGKGITELTYKSNISPDWTGSTYIHNVKIYLKETNQDEYIRNTANKFEWIQVTDDDLFYDKPLEINFDEDSEFTDESDFIIKFTLDRIFNYTTNNLMVMVVQNAPGDITMGTFNDFYCYPSSLTDKPYRTLYKANDSDDLSTAYPILGTGALRQIPAIKISYNNGETCPKPSSLSVNDITSSSVSLDWNSGGSTAWDIKWGEVGATPTSVKNTTDKPYQLTNLTEQTEYEFYVRDNCGSETSTWCGPFTFTTKSSTTNCTLPLSEGFETGFNKFINTTENNIDFTLETIIKKEGMNSIHNAYASNSKNSIVSQCNIDLTGNNSPQLTFWHIGKTEGGCDKCHIQVSVDGADFIDLPKKSYKGDGSYGSTCFDEDSYDEWGTGSEIPDNTWWKKETFDLTAYNTSSNVKIRFNLESDNSENRAGWYIDDIKIKNLSCPKPSNVSVSAIKTTSAKLTWTSGGSAAWDIEWGESEFTPTGMPTIENTTDNPYTLKSLTAETTYDFYVRDDCSSDNSDASDWVGPFTFTTTASCARPTNLTAGIINAKSVNLAWKGYTASNWDIEWGESGFTPTGMPTIENTKNNPYTLSGLKAETTYQYYVRANCSSDNFGVTEWVGPYSFTTPCSTITPDYLEDFETYMPSCWRKGEESISGSIGIGDTKWKEDGFANNGYKGCIKYNLCDTNHKDWLITPIFDLSAGNVSLIFDVAVTKAYSSDASAMGSDDEVQILYSEDGLTWNNLDTWNATNTPSNTGDHKTYDLSAITASNVQFAFWASEGSIDDAENYNFYIDNFEIRALKSNTNIITYSFPESTGNTTIDADTHSIVVEVGNGTIPSALVATFTLSDFATANVAGIKQESGFTANTFIFETPFTYTIIAEDGVSQDWLITVKQADIYTKTDILTYSFAEQTSEANIDITNHKVDVEVAFGTNITQITPTYTLSYGATTTQNTTNFSSPVTYTIIAENGTTTQDWIITVTVAKPSIDANFITYSFKEQTGDATINTTNHKINIEVTACTDLTDLTANFTTSPKASVSINETTQISGSTTNDFTNPVIYKIIAEDGITTQNWTVTVTTLPTVVISSYPYFEGFEDAIMPSCWTVLDEDGDYVKWNLDNNEAQEGVQSTSIMYNEYGNDDWLITPMINVNEDNIFVEFQAKSYVANNLESYNVLVSKTGKKPANFTTVLENVVNAPAAWVQKSYKLSEFGIKNGDNIYIAIQCVSIDKSILKIDAFTLRSLNSETDILTYSFVEQMGNAIIDTDNHTVNIEVAYDTDVTSIVPSFTLSHGATTTQTTNDFSSPVTYKVIAEDGTTTQDWTITVTVAKNNQTDILTYSFAEQTNDAIINNDNHTVNIEVAYDTDVTSIVPSFTLSHGATTTQTTNDFSSPVTYKVIAEDGTTTQDWTITVTVAKNNQTDILTYSFAEQTNDAIINNDNHTVNIKVAYGTDITSIVPSFTLSHGATTTQTTNDFSSPVTYKVTAEDGITTQNWVVTVNVAIGINDMIKTNQVSIYPNPNNGQFNIILNLSTNVTIEIVNILGEIVSVSENVKAKETITINLGNKKLGLYFARISSRNNTIIKKVNIIR